MKLSRAAAKYCSPQRELWVDVTIATKPQRGVRTPRKNPRAPISTSQIQTTENNWPPITVSVTNVTTGLWTCQTGVRRTNFVNSPLRSGSSSGIKDKPSRTSVAGWADGVLDCEDQDFESSVRARHQM